MSISQFDIPVVIIIFRREKILEVIERVSQVKPRKLYILSDGGRTENEKKEVDKLRNLVEDAINWNCEVIKNYSDENRGVYANIGLGAKWVFEREDKAIFLEDDNLPEITFFKFCKEMLEKYEKDTRVLWVCGTNYLGKYEPEDGSSYMFTKHLLPCGWASWGDKFNTFYDKKLELTGNKVILSRVEKQYYNNKLYNQYKKNWSSERSKIANNERPISWDYHMDFTIKSNGLYGISPCNNQIKNIGVDEYSIHGGNTFDSIMTQRFCGMGSHPLEFPLKHPPTVLPDEVYEKRISEILLFPPSMVVKGHVKGHIVKILRRIFNIPEGTRIIEHFKR